MLFRSARRAPPSGPARSPLRQGTLPRVDLGFGALPPRRPFGNLSLSTILFSVMGVFHALSSATLGTAGSSIAESENVVNDKYSVQELLKIILILDHDQPTLEAVLHLLHLLHLGVYSPEKQDGSSCLE